MSTRRIQKNAWDNWNGYIGRSKVQDFGTDEQAAKDWQATGEVQKYRPENFKFSCRVLREEQRMTRMRLER